MYFESLKKVVSNKRYFKIYKSLCSRAQVRAKTRKDAIRLYEYVELHHILPKSFNMGGEEDRNNMVYLTAREHYIAHRLLAKMFDDPTLKAKMGYALFCFAFRPNPAQSKHRKLTSRQYESVRRQFSKNVKEKMRLDIASGKRKLPDAKGENNGMYGKKHRPETIRMWSKKRKGLLSGDRNGMYGKTHTDTVKNKLSQLRKNSVWMYNPATGQNKTIQKEEIASWEMVGWKRGRK